MSVFVTSWVWTNAPKNLSSGELLTALALADTANAEGGCAYPSNERLSTMTRLSGRTIERSLARLVELGVIEIDRPATNRIPTVYRFISFHNARGDILSPHTTLGATSTTSRGDIHDTKNDRHLLKEPSIDPSIEIDTPKPPRMPGAEGEVSRHPEYWTEGMLKAFGIYWDAYPKKIEKQDAMLQWRITLGEKVKTDTALQRELGTGYAKWINFWREEEKELQYIPSFGRWIKRQHWTVDPRGVAK
jgi:hypothetical protein